MDYFLFRIGKMGVIPEQVDLQAGAVDLNHEMKIPVERHRKDS